MFNRKCAVTQASQNPLEPVFEVSDTPIPSEVSRDDVLLKVLACGVCHSDCFAVLNAFGGPPSLVPGHEVCGKVVKTGEGPVAQHFKEGDIVGVGWHGDHCLSCEACTDGDFMCCEKGSITGGTRDGGYQQYMVAPAKVLARVPDGMDPVKAAPLMCAGVTVFNSLRGCNDNVKPPALVGVLGVGGLGHLGIQYAAKFGYTVVAISRGTSKKEQAMELGATHFIDSEAENVAEALRALGGANIILATATSSKAIEACVDGLSRNGKLIILGASPEPILVSPVKMISKRRTIVGWPAGTNRDSQDAMEFAHHHGIEAKTVVFEGVDTAPEAYMAMMRGEYRVVIKVDTE